MPIRHGAPHGAPIWIDLTTSDLDRAQEFYGAVFGWTFTPAGPEYGGYVDIAKDGHQVAGMMANNPDWQLPDSWAVYLNTADVAATVGKVAGAGGVTCVQPMQIPGRGAMALAVDPAGALVGLWQPDGHRGFEVIGEAGAPVWHQLTTTDYRGALDFYRAVFGWQTRTESDTDEFRYTTAVFGDDELLGVMDGAGMLPDGVPSSWVTFFGADEVDKTLAVIADHGGRVLRGAEDTPYGRLAAAADPTGAMFNLSSLPGA
ncbi:MAG: VOC family protein [Mycobacterium sp.]